LILSSPRTPAAASGAGFGGAQPPSNRFVFLEGILVGGPVAKRAVRTTFIVLDTPAFQNNARLTQIAEEFSVQAFIAQLVVKAFNMPVFPRAPGFDVKGLDLLGLQPVLHA